MRITKEAMLRLARDTAAIHANQDRSIVCIYLTGSMVTEDPFIGGTTDIDLFFIHTKKPQITREVIYLGDDISLDIAHIEQSRFQQPRHLRADAWLGPFLCAKPRVLYDTQHWFEFTEASVAAQFYRPEYILERARPFSVSARQTWMDFHLAQPEITPQNVIRFLHCIENAGNAIALLSGTPLTQRRFLLDLPGRIEKLKRKDMTAQFENLLSQSNISDLDWTQWITKWEKSLHQAAASPECPSAMTTPRRNYFIKAVTALSEEHPSAASWLLMNTWTHAAILLPVVSPSLNDWQQSCVSFLQLNDTFESVWDRLDGLLDSVEETLDTYAADNGLNE
jgi:hypothetical protein